MECSRTESKLEYEKQWHKLSEISCRGQTQPDHEARALEQPEDMSSCPKNFEVLGHKILHAFCRDGYLGYSKENK